MLGGLQPQPRRVLEGAGLREIGGRLLIRDDITEALDAAEAHLGAAARRE
jgi:hypothetical protein